MDGAKLTTDALADEALKRLALADETCRISAKLMQLMRQLFKQQRMDLERLIEDAEVTLH